MSATLFVVATPLGNLEDLSPRARRILAEVDLIACEDTRRTATLLETHGLRTPTTAYHEHNEREKTPVIVEALAAGKKVALVSDAGTPAVSDPGYRLVRAAQDAGIPVVPIPGPSAAVAALSVSGLPSDRFLFVGFLPARAGARQRALAELAPRRETLIFYESPLRVRPALLDMQAALGDREGFLFREATKMHEEYRRARLSEIHSLLAARERTRGEIVLVVAGAREEILAESVDAPSVQTLYESLVAEGRTRREAVKEVARQTGLPAREVYRRVLAGSSS